MDLHPPDHTPTPEHKHAKTVTPIDLKDPESIKLVEDFFQRQYQLKENIAQLPKEQRLDLLDFTGLMEEGDRSFRLMLRLQQQHTLTSFNCFTYQSNNQILGICFQFTFPSFGAPDQACSSFVGVDHSHLRQGIATELVRARHRHLLSQGIHQYNVSVWDASKDTIQKAGGTLTPDPDYPGDTKSYLVKI